MYDDMSMTDHYRSVYAPSFIAQVQAKRKQAAKEEKLKEARLKRLKDWAVHPLPAALDLPPPCDRDTLRDFLAERERQRRASNGPYKHSVEAIINRACRAFGCTKHELLGERRHKEIVLARFFVAYWACRLTVLSLPALGKIMRRDHTSTLHSKREYPKKRAAMGRTLRSVR